MHELTEKLIAEKTSNIGWIIFSDPARQNAVSLEMWHALPIILESYVRDPEIRVIILKGAGNQAFITGADASYLKEKRSNQRAASEHNATSETANKALQECPKPTIAMIRGNCNGGGITIAVGCDIRIAADDARFAVPAAKLGLGYRFAAIKRLNAVVGLSFAAQILFTAREFTAHEALRMNLVHRVVAVAELERQTLDCANTIADNAPLTIASIKRSLIECLKNPDERELALCEKMVATCYASEDYQEGQLAFKEKRKPMFKGR